MITDDVREDLCRYRGSNNEHAHTVTATALNQDGRDCALARARLLLTTVNGFAHVRTLRTRDAALEHLHWPTFGRPPLPQTSHRLLRKVTLAPFAPLWGAKNILNIASTCHV
jgi:hypothetical protein